MDTNGFLSNIYNPSSSSGSSSSSNSDSSDSSSTSKMSKVSKFTTALLYCMQLASWLATTRRGGGGGGNADAGPSFNTDSSSSALKTKPLPPPKLGQKLVPCSRLLQDARLCHLCGKEIQNPSQSRGGFIFCYTCLHNYVRQYGKCPITKWKMDTNAVRRLLAINGT